MMRLVIGLVLIGLAAGYANASATNEMATLYTTYKIEKDNANTVALAKAMQVNAEATPEQKCQAAMFGTLALRLLGNSEEAVQFGQSVLTANPEAFQRYRFALQGQVVQAYTVLKRYDEAIVLTTAMSTLRDGVDAAKRASALAWTARLHELAGSPAKAVDAWMSAGIDAGWVGVEHVTTCFDKVNELSASADLAVDTHVRWIEKCVQICPRVDDNTKALLGQLDGKQEVLLNQFSK